MYDRSGLHPFTILKGVTPGESVTDLVKFQRYMALRIASPHKLGGSLVLSIAMA